MTDGLKYRECVARSRYNDPGRSTVTTVVCRGTVSEQEVADSVLFRCVYQRLAVRHAGAGVWGGGDGVTDGDTTEKRHRRRNGWRGG